MSRMLGEVEGEDSSLPLLQFALHRIWEGFRRTLSENDTLDALQGVGGALAFRAEELFQALDERSRGLVRRAFEEMVQLGEGVRDTRRRVRLSDMVPHGATEADLTEALEPFVTERLVSKGTDEAGQITAELTHEALIQHWRTLRRWIDDRRADLRFGRRVQQAATEWWDDGRLAGRLWPSSDLGRLQGFARRCPQDLTQLGTEFLRRSERGKRQQQWITRSVVGAITILFFVATAFGIYSQREARVAQNATAEALLQEARAVSALARQETKRGDAMTATLAALSVMPVTAEQDPRPRSAPAEMALLDAWLRNREVMAIIGHTDLVWSASFSPDGKRVVTASSDKTVVIYPVPFSRELESLARQSLTRCLTTAQREAFGLFVDGDHDEDRYLVRAPPC